MRRNALSIHSSVGPFEDVELGEMEAGRQGTTALPGFPLSYRSRWARWRDNFMHASVGVQIGIVFGVFVIVSSLFVMIYFASRSQA